jgi:hypothetical protein
MLVFVVAKKVREGESASSGLELRIGRAMRGLKPYSFCASFGMAKAKP